MSKSYRLLGPVMLILMCLAGIPLQAADTIDRRYVLADQGTLELKVPTTWKVTVAFTIYTNDGQQRIVTDVLTMLKSAAYSSGKAS